MFRVIEQKLVEGLSIMVWLTYSMTLFFALSRRFLGRWVCSSLNSITKEENIKAEDASKTNRRLRKISFTLSSYCCCCLSAIEIFEKCTVYGYRLITIINIIVTKYCRPLQIYNANNISPNILRWPIYYYVQRCVVRWYNVT